MYGEALDFHWDLSKTTRMYSLVVRRPELTIGWTTSCIGRTVIRPTTNIGEHATTCHNQLLFRNLNVHEVQGGLIPFIEANHS